MPQDSTRSAVCRSFVTCDDPKGVVECRTFRKSKISSQRMEGKHENQKMPKNLNRSISYKEEKNVLFSRGGTEESSRASSFQLMEVSRGAHRLNHVIDSWSKGKSFSGQPNEIAQDLLRGALDLQESLAMLSKLQEASRRVTKLKKKQKEKSDLGNADEVSIGRTSSDMFGNLNYQNPRLVADGCSRDCYDELREVIRDSFARQNLLPNKSSEKKLHCDRRKGDTCEMDMPSTSSSSISSTTCCNDFASFGSSLSSKIISEKPKVPNLIAKLMGLEDIPTKPLQSTAEKKLESDSILNQRKQIFDVDIRKERKPHFVAHKLEKGCMTLDEIIDNMQFKGLLKGNQYQNFQSNTPYVERRLSNGAVSPPIVLMKPSHHPHVEAEDIFMHVFTPVDEALDPEENPRIWKTKEVISSKVEKYPQGALNSNEMHRNFHFKATTVKKTSREKGSQPNKNVQPKQEDREAKFKENLTSNKMKSSAAVSSRSHKVVTEKKVEKVQRTSRKKPTETESVKSSSVPKSQEQDKALSMVKLKPSETGSKIVNKNRTIQQKNTSSNPKTKCKKPAVSYHSESDQKKCVKDIKPAKELFPTNIEPTICMHDDKHIDHWNEADAIVKETAQALQQFSEENTVDDSETLIEDSCDYSPVLLREDTSILPTPLEHDTEIPERNTYGNNDDLSESYPSETREACHIFSENPSFVSHSEEQLANIDATFQPIALHVFTALHDCGISNPKLLFDCANEVLVSSSQRYIPYIHPLLQKPVDDSRFCVSIDHSMDEACKGIKNLCNYSNIGPSRLPTETVSAVLERDLWSKGLMTGAWDMGWRVAHTADDVHQIISEVDKLVLDELIQEVLSDF